MHQFGSLKSHQQEEGNWDTIFKDSAICSRCVKCCIFSLLFPVSLVWSSWLCGSETPGQLCFVSWGCGRRSSSIAVKLTVNRFCMITNKALKLGTKTAEEGRWGEKILVYLSRWHWYFSSFVVYFYWCRHHREIDILTVVQVTCGILLTHFRNGLSLTLSVPLQSSSCLQASALLSHLKYGHSPHPATPFNPISTPYSFCICFLPFEWWQQVRKSGFIRVLP